MLARLASYPNEAPIRAYCAQNNVPIPGQSDLVFAVEDHGDIIGVIMARRNWYIHDLSVAVSGRAPFAALSLINYAIATGSWMAKVKGDPTESMFICDPSNTPALNLMNRIDAIKDDPGITFYLPLR